MKKSVSQPLIRGVQFMQVLGQHHPGLYMETKTAMKNTLSVLLDQTYGTTD